MTRLLAAVCLLVAASDASAQADPIRCWWRTSQGAVFVGEPFDATLTCAAREQDSTRSVTDETRLAAAVVPLAPFEVLGGSHPADLHSPTHRFFQYHYTVRIIDRDAIGREARFPDLVIPYRVQALTNGEWVDGRERTYTIPGHAIRVLSLVPADASDIRDSGDAGFARVEALRFRSRALDIAAYALVTLGALIAAPALVALARRRRGHDTVISPRAPARAVVQAATAELDAIEREARHGWTPDLTARTLSALRLVAAAALGQGVATQPLDGRAPRPGELVVSRGLLRKREFAVSSALTSDEVRRATANLSSATPTARRTALDNLADAMRTLTAVLYRQTFTAQDPRVDEAFASGRRAAREAGRHR
jgi:hypothetical protein